MPLKIKNGTFLSFLWKSAALATLLSCGPFAPAPLSKSKNEESDWDKRFWLEKAQRVSLYGDVLDVAIQKELVTKSKSEILDYLFSDPRFSDAVLDFNYYFLNLKIDNIYEQNNGQKRYVIFNKVSPALNSARAFSNNGNYFSLFDYEQPYFYAGNQMPCKIERTPLEEGCKENYPTDASREEIIEGRKKWANLAQKVYLDTMDKVSSLPEDVEQEKLCSVITDTFVQVTQYLDLVGFDYVDAPTELAERIFNKDFVACLSNEPILTKAAAMNILKKNSPLIDGITQKLILDPKLDPKPTQNISQINDLDLTLYGFEKTTRYDFFSFWFNFQNSSTNFNRRRAAYTLKTFFCDDLTPINIALPSDHSKGRHASDPACASCHYKLDPMAGFFRNHSGLIYSGDMSDVPYFVFDDAKFLKQSEKELYMSNWKNPGEGVRDWNIGYIRSNKDEQLNSYGESLEDLSKIINSAPEVKQCLVKRMAEYFLGRDQIFDGAWLNELSQKFEDASKSPLPEASTLAFKEVAKELLLSNTFAQRNPEPSKCYDFKKGGQESEVPCEVSFNLTKNCTSCHTGAGAAKRLDLSKWTKDDKGRGVFSHLDSNGRQLTAAESLQTILDSLSTQDEKKLMPYLKSMAPVERAQLFQWVEKELRKQ